MYRITKIMIIILSIVLLISVGCPIQATGLTTLIKVERLQLKQLNWIL